MPTYEVLSQTPFMGLTRYSVRLNAASGYSEIQEYIGNTSTLETAQEHFETSIAAISSAVDLL